MKIALYGNTANNFFAVARALRRTSGIDAHLYIDEGAGWAQLPENEDPSLRDGDPDWIHRGPYRTVASRLWPGLSPLARELGRYDLVILSAHGVQLAPFVRSRTVFYTTGGDITVAPFPLRFVRGRKGIASRIALLVGGIWQRRGIASVSQIWTQPFAPFQTALRRLGVPPEKVVSAYFPIMIDTSLYRSDPAATRLPDPDIRHLVDEHDFILFHPSRLMIDAAPALVDAGQWKGNDRLIEGFARFAAANPQARPALVMVDGSLSPDRAAAKQLVASLGIEPRVRWLQPPHEYGFERAQLLPLYSIADAVADDFGVGWFGSVVVEGLSMGRPVLCYVDERVMASLYPWHPILTPRTPDEIAACLTELYRDPAERERRGALGRRWVEEFHAMDRAAERYAAQIAALSGASAEPPRI